MTRTLFEARSPAFVITRVVIGALASLSVSTMATASPDPALTAEELVARCAAAMGGMEQIQAVRTLRVATVYPDHGSEPIVTDIERPNRVRGTSTVFDGRQAAFRAREKDGKVLPAKLIPADEAKDFEVDVAWAFPAFFDHPAEYRGMKAADGGGVHVLEVALPLGATMTYFVDARSFVVIKAAAEVAIGGKTYRSERAFSEFRPAAGVLFPRSFTYPGREGGVVHARVTSLEVNLPFAEDHFAIPAEAR